jgi:hypothetical protein
MKKALMLAGLVLCATMGFAAETRNDSAAEGKKRNEEAYERMLEQTGWKNEKTARNQKESQGNSDHLTEASRAKSS